MEAAKVKCNFFRKTCNFFQKIVKNRIKNQKNYFFQKKYKIVPKLSCLFLKLTGKFFFRLKTDHFHFLVRFRKTHGTGGGANVDGPGENFNIGNLAENEMAYCQHI